MTKAFLGKLSASGLNASDYLIQVIQEKFGILHEEGKIIRTPAGAREWLEPQKYADAVILIGGLGGTFSTWLCALHDGLPRFPLLATDGDAKKAFESTIELWDIIAVPGITKAEFETVGQKIRGPNDAKRIASRLVADLLRSSIFSVDEKSRVGSNGGASLFISYSRADRKWAERLRTLMRPYERRGVIIPGWIPTSSLV